MKNPNHFGTVTKLSGNRRNPYVVKEGKTGRQKIIGYAPTREDGLLILAQYNKNPWDIDAHKITFSELYDLWLKKRAIKLGASNQSALKTAYTHCKSLYDVRYSDIKPYQMQECIDGCGRGYSTQGAIKNLFGHLDRFALELDVIQKRCSELLTSAPIPETTKTVFSLEETTRLWENQNLPYVDTVLFLIYTGFRITEMLTLKIEQVDLDALTITGGIKTESGKNRIVPIHSKIVPIVKTRYSHSRGGYLFEESGKAIPESMYRNHWSELMNLLKMSHTPHECRHTLRSRLDSAGANKVCIDRIMGHKSKGTGERVYTHKNIDELRLNIELVTN